jgi:hypothetical protein
MPIKDGAAANPPVGSARYALGTGSLINDSVIEMSKPSSLTLWHHQRTCHALGEERHERRCTSSEDRQVRRHRRWRLAGGRNSDLDGPRSWKDRGRRRHCRRCRASVVTRVRVRCGCGRCGYASETRAAGCGAPVAHAGPRTLLMTRRKGARTPRMIPDKAWLAIRSHARTCHSKASPPPTCCRARPSQALWQSAWTSGR